MSPAMLKAAIESGGIKTRADAGREYALIIAVFLQRGESEQMNGEIGELNMAIVKRWSPRGLEWVKKQGWELYKQAQRPQGSLICHVQACSCGGSMTPTPCPPEGAIKIGRSENPAS